MLPKPPFACDLPLEQELEEFDRLKPRLAEVWNALIAHEDAPATSIVVPSLTLDPGELEKLSGSSYYELEISPANIVCELRIARPWPELQGDRAWDCAGLETVVRRIGLEPGGQPGWTATACLPWDGLAALSGIVFVRNVLVSTSFGSTSE